MASNSVRFLQRRGAGDGGADVGAGRGLVERKPPKPPPKLWFRPPADDGLLAGMADTIPSAFVARALGQPQGRGRRRRSGRRADLRALLVGTLIMAKRSPSCPGECRPAAAGVGGLRYRPSWPCISPAKLPVPQLDHGTRPPGPRGIAHEASTWSHAGRSSTAPASKSAECIRLPEDLRRYRQDRLLRTLLTVRFFRPGSRPGAAVDPNSRVSSFFHQRLRAGARRCRCARQYPDRAEGGGRAVQLKRTEFSLGFFAGVSQLASRGILLPVLRRHEGGPPPRPTDAAAWPARRRLQSDELVGTPTFVSYIVYRPSGRMASLRLIVVGAESARRRLRSLQASGPEAALLEGYGVTECSPVVAVNGPAPPSGTVGPPLPASRFRW